MQSYESSILLVACHGLLSRSSSITLGYDPVHSISVMVVEHEYNVDVCHCSEVQSSRTFSPVSPGTIESERTAKW